MNSIEKLLKKISKKDKEKILIFMEEVVKGNIKGIKLKGINQYRIRVGGFRIKYSIKDGKQVIDEVRRRDENTYRK